MNSTKNINKNTNDEVNKIYFLTFSSGCYNLFKTNKLNIIPLMKLRIKKIIIKAANGAKLAKIELELLLTQ